MQCLANKMSETHGKEFYLKFRVQVALCLYRGVCTVNPCMHLCMHVFARAPRVCVCAVNLFIALYSVQCSIYCIVQCA